MGRGSTAHLCSGLCNSLLSRQPEGTQIKSLFHSVKIIETRAVSAGQVTSQWEQHIPLSYACQNTVMSISKNECINCDEITCIGIYLMKFLLEISMKALKEETSTIVEHIPFPRHF